MTCRFESEVDYQFEFDYLKYYEGAVLTALDSVECPYESDVSLLIVDDASIREINADNRNIDRATDVLSFPMNDFSNPADFSDIEETGTFDPDSGELILGDIVISYEHVLAQANEYGHSIEREFTFLIVHSILHLCGFDHIEESDRVIMEDKQKEIMALLSEKYEGLEIG